MSLNQLAFQEVKSPKDTLTKTGTENETKAENKVIKMKEKMRDTRSLQIKRNYANNQDFI